MGNVGCAISWAEDSLFVLHENRVFSISHTVDWTFTPEGETLFLQMLTTESHVHLLGLDTAHAKAQPVHVVLSHSGALLQRTVLPALAPLHNDPDPVLLYPGVVAHLSQGGLISLPLPPSSKPHPLPGKYAQLIPLPPTPGLVVGVKEDGSACVLATQEGGLTEMWEYADSARSAMYTESVFAGAVDRLGGRHIARVYWTHTFGRADWIGLDWIGWDAKLASIHLWSEMGPGGKGGGMVSGFTFPFDTKSHGVICTITLEVAFSPSQPQPQKPIPRFLITTSTGSIQLWQADQLQWTREEGLAELVGGVGWADRGLAAPGGLGLGLGLGGGGSAMGLGERGVGDAPEGLGEKWARQLGSIWKLPGYGISFLLRFTDSLSLFPPSASFQQSALNKLALVASSSGKLYALETAPSAPGAPGGVLWSQILGVSGAPGGMGRVDVQRILSVAGVGWVVLGRRWDEHGFKTAAWSIDPLTGTIYPPPGREGTTPGLTLFPGPMAEAFVLPPSPSPSPQSTSHNETVVIVSQSGEVYLFPTDEARKAALASRSREGVFFSLPLHTGDVSSSQAALQGFTLLPSPDADGFASVPTYRTFLTPSPKSELLGLIRPPRGPVASLGRVLGTKQTLYKYLNPHLVVALTQYPVEGEGEQEGEIEIRCGIHLVDQISGSIIYSASVRKPRGRACDVKPVLADNWLVWVFWNDGDSGVSLGKGKGEGEGEGGRTKGWRVVVVELYEGEPDEITRSAQLSGFASNSSRVHGISQTYGVPSAWKAVTTTLTKYGITLKDVVVANDRGQIQAYPHALLDPRRPSGKLTSEQKEELLIPFDSVITDDPRRTVSQNLHIMGISSLSTTPTALESTSLLLASGLDIFLARLSPSSTFDILGENFNKTQLILTVLGLLVAIVIVKPIVESKKVRQRWYTTN
ncbi:DUF1620-domain-containing protein [Dacryopinax primogenitus]|uniref:ER membrane protein complex subunit 1 n=1 Tax=Dacryopinax primogenitus (strain DJM 731) TaxID=1858805 RepID=M5G032_DACPD|nr:DUF1620-domain-containing protein [Dacryopinax primogenitus]EJT97132.1 DUF1620-domain-containing protein [Dacryopinax primogenitus]